MNWFRMLLALSGFISSTIILYVIGEIYGFELLSFRSASSDSLVSSGSVLPILIGLVVSYLVFQSFSKKNE